MKISSENLSLLMAWLELSHGWLTHLVGSNLQPPHQRMRNHMRSAHKENRADQVWESMNQLALLSGRIPNLAEQGEILVECAMMAARLGNIKDALSMFLSAESKFNSYMHQRSVTQWMLGCIYWTLSETVDGITYWESAITGFKQRQEKCKNDGAEADWYKERVQKSEIYLSAAIDQQSLPTLAEEVGISGASASPVILQWNTVPVMESVPAGGFGPAPESRTPVRLEMDEVLIDGKRYQAFSVHQGQHTVRLGADKAYLVVKVTGESMSNAHPVPIENGDYVLLHRQEAAQEQDIVIAEISGQNARATLKRFSKRNNKIIFKAEPKNPKYHDLDPEREMDEFDDNYRIDGIVDAVFKPKQSA